MPQTRATPQPSKRKTKSRRARETKTAYIAKSQDALAHLRANERAALADYVARLRDKFFARMEKYLREEGALDP
jgi:hypothetical protein